MRHSEENRNLTSQTAIVKMRHSEGNRNLMSQTAIVKMRHSEENRNLMSHLDMQMTCNTEKNKNCTFLTGTEKKHISNTITLNVAHFIQITDMLMNHFTECCTK